MKALLHTFSCAFVYVCVNSWLLVWQQKNVLMCLENISWLFGAFVSGSSFWRPSQRMIRLLRCSWGWKMLCKMLVHQSATFSDSSLAIGKCYPPSRKVFGGKIA